MALINKVTVNGMDADGATPSANTQIVGGKTVDITALPSTTTGKVRSWLFNMLTGAGLVQQADLSYLIDSVKSFVGYTASSVDAPTTYRNIALSNTKTQVSAVGCNLYEWSIINPAGTNAQCFVKFYDALATNVTVGTTTPVKTICIPLSTSTVCGSSFITKNAPLHTFLNAMTIVVTLNMIDSDATAPTNPIYVELKIK